MYLVFISNEFFGNTMSKKVVKALKGVFPNTHALKINEDTKLKWEYAHMDSDVYQIKIYELTDRFGNDRQVVSTEYDIWEATKWINDLIWDRVSFDGTLTQDMFNGLPVYIARHLGNFHPIEEDFIFDDNMMEEDSHIFDLTYEGYLMYQKRGELNELEKDIRLLRSGR